MPCRRENENVFSEVLSIWILCEVVAEIRYNGNVCMVKCDVSVSNASFYLIKTSSQLTQ